MEVPSWPTWCLKERRRGILLDVRHKFLPPVLLWSHDPSGAAICVAFRRRRQAVVATRTSDELHADLALVGKLLNHRCWDPGQERSLEIKKGHQP